MKRENPLFFLTLLVCTGVLSAQQHPKYEVYVSGGVSQPYYPRRLGEDWRWGFNGGIGLGYRLFPKLVMEGAVDFHLFRFDDIGYYTKLGDTGYITTVDGKSSWVGSVAGNARYFLSLSSDEKTFLFLSSGVGVQRTHIGEIRELYQTLEEGLIREAFSASTTNYGLQFHLGGGVDLSANSDRSYYLEARYVFGFLNDYNSGFLAVKVGIRQRIR